jgi:hypothetical protein
MTNLFPQPHGVFIFVWETDGQNSASVRPKTVCYIFVDNFGEFVVSENSHTISLLIASHI